MIQLKGRTVSVNDKQFFIPELSKDGFILHPLEHREYYNKKHFIVKTVHSIFETNGFEFPHTPIKVSNISELEKFSQKNDLRILDMPIKFPDCAEHRIPIELIQFKEAISRIISMESEINPYYKQYFAYLTVDQKLVLPGETQRTEGCHVDGFQGARIVNKLPITRSYIVYDCLPTVFYAQAFKTRHLNPETDNFFSSFNEQALEENELRYDPYKIVLGNSYTVHRASFSDTPVYRTFLRISFDTRIYDRYGNTKNPMFSYQWSWHARTVQRLLKHKPLPKYDINAL